MTFAEMFDKFVLKNIGGDVSSHRLVSCSISGSDGNSHAVDNFHDIPVAVMATFLCTSVKVFDIRRNASDKCNIRVRHDDGKNAGIMTSNHVRCNIVISDATYVQSLAVCTAERSYQWIN